MAGQRGLRLALVATCFIAPSLVPLVLFLIAPMVSSLGISLLDWDLISPAEFIGLGNYRALLADEQFHAAVGHTLLYLAGYLPLVYVGGLAVALALHQRIRGIALFRGAYFLPVVTSWVVVALVWKWLLNPEYGLVNQGLAAVGIQGPGWWLDERWAMPSIIIASAWKDLGYVMILFLAGLQSIPEELYEAAKLDGAGAWTRFRRITLPLLGPTSFFVVVISLINNFQVFDQVYVMTGGGPNEATTVVVQQIVQRAFEFGDMGYAAAMSWLLFLVILLVTLVQFRLQRRWVHYG